MPDRAVAGSSGDIYSQNLTDALIAGHTYLGDEPPVSQFQTLKNPYDYYGRIYNKIHFKWDCAYWNGKYYLYFGVIPAILFFVPFKLLTGYYLNTAVLAVCSLVIYSCSLSILFCKIVYKFLPKTKLYMYIIGLIVLNSSGGAFLFAARLYFYEMVTITGYAFVTLGILVLFIAGENTNGKKWKLGLGALLMALAVGCRPTMLLYSLLLIPYIYQHVIVQKKARLSEIMTFLFPYVLVGTFLMLYNYSRFGKIAEFGTSYQLTMVDTANELQRISYLPYILWYMFIQPYKVNLTYPYVYYPDLDIQYIGYFTCDSIISLFPSNIFLLGLFFKEKWRKLQKQWTKTEMYTLYVLILIGGGLAILVGYAGGLIARYVYDFSVALTVAALLLMIGDQASVNKHKMGIIIAAYCVFFIAFISGITSRTSLLLTVSPKIYYEIAGIFSL